MKEFFTSAKVSKEIWKNAARNSRCLEDLSIANTKSLFKFEWFLYHLDS